MNYQPPNPSFRAAIKADGPVSVADLIARLNADASLSDVRRRDLTSALRRLAGLLDRDPQDVPANAGALRTALRRINPAQHGLSRKTFANLRSNVLAALRHAGGLGGPTRSMRLTADWEALQQRLPDKRLRNGLSRLMRFCSAHGIEPEAIDAGTMAAFLAHLETATFLPRPLQNYRQVCRLWNEAEATVPGWPNVLVAIPDARRPRRHIALDDLPESFRHDLDAYLTMRANPDPFDENASVRALKPSTLRLRREQLRVAASTLIQRGGPTAVRSLADLVTPSAFKEILRHLLGNHDNQANAWTEGIAKTLIGVAKEWGRVDPDQLAELRRLMGKLPQRTAGMTKKNRETLRQFEDDANLDRLLTLPRQLFDEALRVDPPTVKAAVKMQLALALELLLHCPVRSHNLIALEIDKHVIRPAGSRGRTYLCLEPQEVKNEQQIDFELAPSVAQMLDVYMRRYLPVLGGGACRLIFCTASRRRKAQSTLAQQIQEIIFKRLGLKLTPHQFRHLSGKLLLEANPGAFETLRQLLGHKSLKTTIGTYAELDTRQAGRIHDHIVETRRQELAAKARGRGGRKSRKRI